MISDRNDLPEMKGDELIRKLKTAVCSERYPILCQWEITCRCNLRCKMCYTDCFNRPDKIKEELATDEILRILDEMGDAGVLEVILTGGEPLARADFKEIYTHAVSRGFLTTVFTNGTLIDSPTLEMWEAYPPAMIEISYLGADPATFDLIAAVGGTFERVNRGMERILKAGLPLTIKTTAMTLNRDEIGRIASWARKYPQARFKLGTEIRLALDGSSLRHFELPDHELDQWIGAAPELVKDAQRRHEEETRDQGCHEGKNRFHIDAYGNLQLCSANRRQGYNLRTGNFKEGFYNHLRCFPCPRKRSASKEEMESSVHASV